MRVMGFIKDLLGLFQKNTILFEEKIIENEGVVSFLFTPVGNLTWLPGQHAGFTIPKANAAGKPTKPFSIASTPDEGVIRVTTKVPENPSAYKRYLMSLNPGDSIIMSGPIGNFYVEDTSKSILFIAGGIGITPYRALLKNYDKNKTSTLPNFKLLYINSSSEFTYKNELDALQEANDFISIKYLTERTTLTEEITRFANEHGNNACYFISGTPDMINSIKELLKENGIRPKAIKSDSFRGY
jgi:ferredoxin-NADP reductase